MQKYEMERIKDGEGEKDLETEEETTQEGERKRRCVKKMKSKIMREKRKRGVELE